MDNPNRRNATPESVRIMGPADFPADAKLNEKEDQIAENRYEILIHNLEYYLRSKGIPQARFCAENLGKIPYTTQITSYKKCGKDIPYRTMVRLALACGYTPEMMCGQLLDRQPVWDYGPDHLERRPDDEYQKYVGTYHMAFFGTDARLGGNRRTTARMLTQGMLSIYLGNAVNGVPTLDIVAFTCCTEEDEKKLTAATGNAEALGGARAIRTCYEKVAETPENSGDAKSREKYLYEGIVLLTERTTMLTMKQCHGSDVVQIELHNRAANSSQGSHYKGGLGTMMSTSRGQEHMPCIQAVVLSKRSFDGKAREVLADQLFLEPPEVDVTRETADIISYMKALFPEDHSENPLSKLSDSDKAFVLESYIEKKLTDVIKRNVLGYYKVSTEMDDKIYKTICR